ncbi:hypothetical protein IKQ19_17795 [Candidatus Saccharibacteria bacterium]|nr:hypothetical protein [Candidatus Saccharibacteria bacterium]
MKILYILVSSPSDYYYEQALLSIMSAKYKMPGMSISLLIDNDTKKYLEGSRSKILELVNEFQVIEFENSVNPMIRSRSLKTMMREYVEGDFLYVDVDTLWVNPIDESDFYTDVMGVPDAHVELLKHPCYDYIKKEHSKLGFDLKGQSYLNGGVLYLKDSCSAHEFMKDWNEYWKYSCEKGIPTDQKSLNYVVSKNNCLVGLLPNCYNVQISYTIRHLLSAKLIHYFGSAKNQDESKLFFELQKRSFWKKIKESDRCFDLMRDVVKCPEKYFSTSMVLLDAECEYAKHPSYGLLCDIIKSKNKRAKIFLKILDYTFFMFVRILNLFKIN